MKYGSGQSDNGLVLGSPHAHLLPVDGGETCESGYETDHGFAGSSSSSYLSPNGKSKR
jgi:hypothetical protein